MSFFAGVVVTLIVGLAIYFTRKEIKKDRERSVEKEKFLQNNLSPRKYKEYHLKTVEGKFYY